jgi:hypothetical protein
MTIVEAVNPGHMDQVRILFQEYWDSFGFTPSLRASRISAKS